MSVVFVFFFFFQAEDGIRDTSVTGVQTCALPICPSEKTPVKPLVRLSETVRMTNMARLIARPCQNAWPLASRTASAIAEKIGRAPSRERVETRTAGAGAEKIGRASSREREAQKVR